MLNRVAVSLHSCLRIHQIHNVSKQCAKIYLQLKQSTDSVNFRSNKKRMLRHPFFIFLPLFGVFHWGKEIYAYGAGLGCCLWIASTPCKISSESVISNASILSVSCSKLVAPIMVLVTKNCCLMNASAS